MDPGAHTSVDGEIWRLSAATFVALVSEPLLLLADSAIVGHLGTPELAGLGIATAVLGTVMSISIFLAYGTTSGVSQLVGAGRSRDALALGVDGLWLAVVLGTVVTVVGVVGNHTIVGWFGPSPEVAVQAEAYLQIGWLGTVPLLIMLASVGVLRGFKDVRTPMVVAVLINLTNIGLNVMLVYGLGWGIRGAATGTVLSQLLAAVVLGAAVLHRARAAEAALAPDRAGIRAAAHAGVPLVVRTILLRAALLLMTWQATSYGAPELAAMQLALTIWTFLSFALDALGVSAQTLVGTELGRGDRATARELTTRLIGWSLGLGAVFALVLLVTARWLGPLFTDDALVRAELVPVLVVAALVQPVAGVVFVLDGILIGAGDTVYLAWGHAAVLVVFAPFALWAGDLTMLWVAFAAGFMGSRAVMLLRRARSDRWMDLAAAGQH